MNRPFPSPRCAASLLAVALALPVAAACSEPTDKEPQEEETVWECQLTGPERPDFAQAIGCKADFELVAGEPLTATVAGATSVKTIVDQLDGDALYFQDSQEYQIHWEFAYKHLSGNGKPVVPPLDQFSQTEYQSAARRFILGSVTYYAANDIWAYEIAGYDTASPEMIERAYRHIADAAFFGDDLHFHPISEANVAQAAGLPADIPIVENKDLYGEYQPLNIAESVGRLRFLTAADLASEATYVTYRDIAVLDAVPNDISVVQGIITAEYQTPLSHINVLSKNRGTPNMALKDAQANAELVGLRDKWVRLNVGPHEYTIVEVSQEEADLWWEQNKPPPLGVPSVDLSVTDLVDLRGVIDATDTSLLKSEIKAAIPALGGKASHYAALLQIPDMPTPEAFAVPIFFYDQFMVENGFDVRVTEMMADPAFIAEPAVRDQKLGELRDAMELAPVNAEFEQLLLDKLATNYPGTRMRFRSSTNAEDLEGFTGAGLYTSKSGDPNDPKYPVLDAVRTVWASVWRFRAFEEREYRGIDHSAVGMALLSHRSFPDEEANGVAITSNIFDTSGGLDTPAYYVNVQFGEASVVLPDPGVTTDQFLYYFGVPNQPTVYLATSNLTNPGEHVLTNAQVNTLGNALTALHAFFAKAYATKPPGASDEWFYAMDVEFKFDGQPGEEPQLYVKQARPYGG